MRERTQQIIATLLGLLTVALCFSATKGQDRLARRPLYVASFLPSDLSQLKVWLKADALSSSDGNSVSTFTDQSGLGNSPAQATGANQPIYKTNIQNGKPVVRFDGSNDYMTLSLTSVSQPYTISVVASWPSTADRPLFDSNGCGTRFYIRKDASSKLAFGFGSEVVDSGTGPTSTFHIFTVIGNGASSVIRMDGVQKATGNAGSNAFSTLTLGAYCNQSNPAAIDIAEFIVWGADHTASISLIESYQNAKYAVY